MSTDVATYEWAMDWCGVHEGQRNDPDHGDDATCDMGCGRCGLPYKLAVASASGRTQTDG